MSKRETVTAVIVAAGEGKRLGAALPKAFMPLGGRPLFEHSLMMFDNHEAIGEIVLVVAESMMATAGKHVASLNCRLALKVVVGGAHRWQSVCNGVAATEAHWVLVHDAARPFVDAAAIDALLAKRGTYRCAIIGTPCVDTVRTFSGDRCTGTLDRTTLVRVGTPQLFHRQALIEAFQAAEEMAEPPTDEAMLMESRGTAVGLAWGSPLNFKVTTPEDFELARALLMYKTGSSD